MKFEHEVLLAEAAPGAQLSAPQLWAALVLRANDPGQFMPALQACHIDARGCNEAGFETLSRRLDFGSFEVRDEATLIAPHTLQMETLAGPSWPASRFAISILVNEEGQLLGLRFCYASDEPIDNELGEVTHALRCQAYQAADRDMVKRIQLLAAEGALDIVSKAAKLST